MGARQLQCVVWLCRHAPASQLPKGISPLCSKLCRWIYDDTFDLQKNCCCAVLLPLLKLEDEDYVISDPAFWIGMFGCGEHATVTRDAWAQRFVVLMHTAFVTIAGQEQLNSAILDISSCGTMRVIATGQLFVDVIGAHDRQHLKKFWAIAGYRHLQDAYM